MVRESSYPFLWRMPVVSLFYRMRNENLRPLIDVLVRRLQGHGYGSMDGTDGDVRVATHTCNGHFRDTVVKLHTGEGCRGR